MGGKRVEFRDWTSPVPENNVISNPTQIPLSAVVNIEITGSDANRNAGILSNGIIFAMK